MQGSDEGWDTFDVHTYALSSGAIVSHVSTHEEWAMTDKPQRPVA